MQIRFPGITEDDLQYAIECLEGCRQEHARSYGFRYPYFAPGGAYGAQWWQLDSSLALCGYKWIDRAFCERALLNFIESQKEDGRICLWGADVLPAVVAGGNRLRQTEGASSLPKLFDAAYQILRGSTDRALKMKTYTMLKKYLDWWFSARQDPETGLITAVFEETFIPYLGCAGEYAPVDTNVEVYVGCNDTALLAEELGYASDADALRQRQAALGESINRFLWNEETGAYYPYYVRERRLGDCLMASAFYPLRMGIAPADRRQRLLTLMRSQAHFGWDTLPLTSVSKTDSAFTATTGQYQGNASWSGSVWTLINEMAVRGLCDCGEHALAAELAWKTLCAFRGNCAEFLHPFDGSGHGVKRYGWTASQYLELLIEVIFGVDYNAAGRCVTITPRIPAELAAATLALHDLQLEKGISLDITVEGGRVSAAVSDPGVKCILHGNSAV
ncbi:MAG: hypothetical protein J6C52_13605 [Clostridia bacterium]|nr:hypothetical protein [Clostridia bacterium]